MIGLHKNFVNNLVFMGSNPDPAVDKARSQIDDGRAELTLATGRSGIMRGTLTASMGLLLLAGCGPKGQAQEAQRPTPEVASADGGQVAPTLVADKDGQMKPIPVSKTEEVIITQREVVAALKVVPEAKPYIDNYGDFDYAKARAELGAIDARGLKSKWRHALSKATREA